MLQTNRINIRKDIYSITKTLYPLFFTIYKLINSLYSSHKANYTLKKDKNETVKKWINRSMESIGSLEFKKRLNRQRLSTFFH